MNTTTATKKFALATLAAPVLAALAIGLAGTAHADSSGPETTISVQDQGAKDGARVDTQAIQGTVNSTGIQGISRPATQGTSSDPLMDAKPQYTAG